MINWINRYKWIVVAVSLLIGAASVIMIPKTETDPDMRNYVPDSMSSREETDKIENEFGVQDMIMIMFSDSCILSNENLTRIKKTDRAVSGIKGVSNYISPFTMRSIKSEEGMMIVKPLIDKLPVDESECRLLCASVLENRFARDIVISSDMTTASITATINNLQPETVTLAMIDSVIAANPGDADVIKGGLPYIRESIQNDVTEEALVLVPVALLIMLIILKLNLGTWKSVMMPFCVVLLSTAFSMALLPVLGWKLSIMTLLVPVILIAVANNYGIYLVARSQELMAGKKKEDLPGIIKKIVGSLRKPILFSGLTTMAGILGLLMHSVIPAKQVGALAAAGVLLALSSSLILIPALLFINGPGSISKSTSVGGKLSFDSLLRSLSAFIVNYPGRILLVSFFLIAIISSGIIFLRINTNQENYFSANHPVRKASEIINSKFGGSQTISVMITGDIKNPGIMKRIDDFSLRMEEMNGVGNVYSISQAVREMSKAIFTDDEDGYDRIPGTGEAISQMFELYFMSGNQDDFSQLMNPECTKAHILIRLSEPENEIVRDIKNEITRLTAGFPAEVTIGGYALIMSDFAGSIIKGQVSSLLFAVITVVILLTIIFRSFKGGLIGTIPLVASVLILFGFMGYTGIALDAATALLSSLMIGVGVDFTIQYIWCFKTKLQEGLTYPGATESALRAIGRSIIINGITVMAGFSALIFSGFTSIRFFAYLVVISIGSCLAGAIIIIPAILVRFRPKCMEIKLENNKIEKHENKSDLINATSAAFSGSWTAP